MPRRFAIEHALPTPCYGIVRQRREDSDELECFAAVEVRAPGRIPDGMETVQLPAATYARFAHRGAAEAVDRTVSYAYSTWLVQSGRRHTYGADLEIYGAQYHPRATIRCSGTPIPIAG